MSDPHDIPYGCCHCGCGEKTKPYRRTNLAEGQRRGQPQRFIYGHQRRSSPVDFIEDPETHCWLWQRATDHHGYGRVFPRGRSSTSSHRAVYEELVGPIPDGLELDHLCRVPACCNPGHLEPVTHAENGRRGARAKLTMEKAREIRTLKGKRSASEIGGMYGVSKRAVLDILNGLHWREDV